MLYERRFGPFFVEPIVAGLDPVTFQPYICNMDLIGTNLICTNRIFTTRRLHHRAGRLRGGRDVRGAADGDVRDPVGAQDEARPAVRVHFPGKTHFNFVQIGLSLVGRDERDGP